MKRSTATLEEQADKAMEAGIKTYEKNNYKKALDCFSKAMKISLNLDAPQQIAESYERFGLTTFEVLGLEEAMKFLNKALAVRKMLDFFPDETASTLSSIGQVHFFSGKLDEALTYYEEALGIYRGLDSTFTYEVVLTLFIIGKIQSSLGQHEKRLNTLKRRWNSRERSTIRNRYSKFFC